MMKIPLQIRNFNISESKRIYRIFPYCNIEIHLIRRLDDLNTIRYRVADDTLIKIIRYHSNHLKRLLLENVSVRCAAKLLKICKNVEELYLNLKYSSLFKPTQIILSKLKILKIQNDYGLYQSIRATNLNMLEKFNISNGLNDFLKRSPKINILKVSNSIHDLYDVDLNLQKLSCGAEYYDVDSSIRFLESQKSTLEELNLPINLTSDSEIINCILCTLRLKKLCITIKGNSFNSDCFRCNNTIKNLQVYNLEKNDCFSEIFRYFNAVEELKIIDNKNDSLDIEVIADSFLKLEVLHLSNCGIIIAKDTLLKNVKYLNIFSSYGSNKEVNWAQLTLACPSIRKLEITLYNAVISLLDLHNILTACKKIEVIVINALKFKIIKDYVRLNLDDFNNLKSISLSGCSREEVINELKNCCDGKSKLIVDSNKFITFRV